MQLRFEHEDFNVKYYEHLILIMFVYLNIMSKSSTLLPKEKRILDQLGENLRLARLRRRLSAEMVAERAGISRTTLWNMESGRLSSSVSILLSVLAVYGLGDDLLLLAKDDSLGRKIQDAELSIGKRASKKNLR